MEIMEGIRKRYSVRAFRDQEVEKDKLESVLEAGRLAPSASNRQEWRFIVVRDQILRQKLADAAHQQKFVSQAPVIIAACGVDAERIMSCGHPAYLVDVTIAVDHMTLKAVEEGLGTCWIGAFDGAQVKEILDIPEKVRVVTLLPLGYPAGDPSRKHSRRKNLSEIVMYNGWG